MDIRAPPPLRRRCRLRLPTATASAPKSWMRRCVSSGAAGAQLDLERIEIGEAVYNKGLEQRHRAVVVGIAAPHEGLSQGADHDAARRRFQEPQRHRTQDARDVRQRAAVRVAASVRFDQAPEHGHRDRARERGRRLRRHRAPANQSGRAVPQVDFASRQQADRALCVRIRAREQTQKSHVFHQRQHHEDHRRALPPDLRRDRAENIPRSNTSTGSSISAPPKWPTRPKRSTSS